MENDEELVTNITPAALIGLLNREKEPAPAQDADFEEATLAPEVREQRRLARKPIIDHLKSGVLKDGDSIIPLFDIGDRVVVERKSSLLAGTPWLDTQIFTIESIDDETGVARGWHEELQRSGFFGFRDPNTDVRLAPKRGNPFKAVAVAREEKKAEKKANNEPIRRGRPKGSKNRSKDEIKAEKLARKAERDAKKAKRKARIGGHL